MFTVDLHAHTRFFHGFQGRPTPFDPIGAQLLALSSQRAHPDAVALAEYHWHTTEAVPRLSRIRFVGVVSAKAKRTSTPPNSTGSTLTTSTMYDYSTTHSESRSSARVTPTTRSRWDGRSFESRRWNSHQKSLSPRRGRVLRYVSPRILPTAGTFSASHGLR